MIASLWLAAALTAGASPLDPASPEGLLEAGHWKQLRAVVEPRLRANPNDARAALLLSRVKLVGGDLDGALPLAEKAVALEPNNAEYHYQIGAIYGRKAQTAGFFSRFA